MSLYEKWRKLVEERDATVDHAYWLLDDVWERQVDLLASDVTQTLEVLDCRFGEEDVQWFCEILEDLVERTGEPRFVAAARRLVEEYPAVAECYLLRNYVGGAERILDYLESKGGVSGGGTERGEVC